LATAKELQELVAQERERREKVEQRAKEMEQKSHGLERNLKETLEERDAARNNMQGFNEREEELYRKLRESDRIRREMHSRIMQLMGNIRVFVRVRPPLPGEIEEEKRKIAESQENRRTSIASVDSNKKRKRDSVAPKEEVPFRFPGVYDRDDKKHQMAAGMDDLTKNIIEVQEPYKDRGGLKDRRKKWRFCFDDVFSPNHGQEDVWEAAEPLVQSAVDGFNVTLFAYGQTGSGKTYTMLGEEGNQGIIGRAVKKMFEAKQEMEDLSKGTTKVSLSVELLEVYNEKVRDLLSPDRDQELAVTSQEVVGNIVVPTSTKEDVLHVLSLAQSRRCVKKTLSNSESSRSHMIFTVHFDVTTKDGMQRTGKLNICDLAGSERLSKSGAHLVGGALLEETKNINKSLSVLSNVIERLQAGDKNVPFRESKLTWLLRNSLSGNSKTLAIICCNPLASHIQESLCSLRFAEKANRVDLKAAANFSC
jgi:kinesin family protein C1